jgi:hypothetical protein
MSHSFDDREVQGIVDTLKKRTRTDHDADGPRSQQSSRAPSPQSVGRTSIWVDTVKMNKYLKTKAAIPWTRKHLNVSISCTFQASSDHWFASNA